MAANLWPHQKEALQRVKLGLQQGYSSGIVHLFTGGGKSFVAVELTRRLFDPREGKRTVAIGGINELLVSQMYNNYRTKFSEISGEIFLKHESVPQGGTNGVVPGLGVVMGRRNDTRARVICASIQTLVSKDELGTKLMTPELEPIKYSDIDFNGDKITLRHLSKRRWLVSPRFDPILAQGIIHQWQHDEAHHAPADGSRLIIERIQEIYRVLGLPPLVNIGFTATPVRNDNREMASLYETIFISRGIDYGQENGYLTPLAEPISVNISEYQTESGMTVGLDEDESLRLDAVNNWKQVISDTIKEKANDRKIISYVGSVNEENPVDSSIALSTFLNQEGISSVHFDGTKTINRSGIRESKSKRGEYLEELGAGQLHNICNYNVLIEGIDVPGVDCIILARPVNSVTFTQMLGRALRLAPNKKDVLLIDFTGQPLILATIASIRGDEIPTVAEGKLSQDELEEILFRFRNAYLQLTQLVTNWNSFHTTEEESRLCQLATTDIEIENNQDITLILSFMRYVDEEQDVLLDGMMLRNADPNISATDKTYSVAQILRSTQGAWHSDEHNKLLSLAIGASDAFVIHPPLYQWAGIVQGMQKELILRQSAEDPPDEVMYKYIWVTPDQFLGGLNDVLDFTYRLFSQYTAWHINNGNVFKASVVGEGGGWLYENPSLSILESDVYQHAQQLEESASILRDKSKSWHYKAASAKQISLLAKLMGYRTSEELPKNYRQEVNRTGKVVPAKQKTISKLITHASTTKPVARIVQNSIDRIQQWKEY